MSLKKLLLPAAVLISVMAFLSSHANAQTMGEYATTTSVASTGSGSFSTRDVGESSRTWGVSGVGSSWADRAGAASGSGLGADFASRAASMSNESATESRWPDTGLSTAQGITFESSRLEDGADRFSSGDSSLGSSKERFTPRDFSSESRWPTSALADSKSGLDTSYNSISGN